MNEPKPQSPGRLRQMQVYVEGAGGGVPAIPVDPARLEAAARHAMSREAFAYVAGGAGTEATMAANRAAFAAYRIVPRMLRDTATRDMSVEILGRRLRAPLLLAPIGVLELAHRDGERPVARAARATGVPMILSNQASVAMEECAGLLGDTARWFQLYWSSDDDLTRSLVRRAEACGCEAIVLTLDTTLLGWRPRDLDIGYLPFLRGMGIAQYLSDPVFRSRLVEPPPPSAIKPRGIDLPRTLLALLRNGKPHGLSFSQMRSAVARFVATYSRPDLAWPDVRRLRDMTKLPIVLKGILHPDDARLAREHGADAIIVSNHGGRQVDGAVATLQQLPAITAAAGDLPVLFDSGVRSGADVFKALALGARAVLLGRPYVFGLAVAGERGVREAIENVVAEIDLTMALSGCRSRVEITAACLSTV